MRLCQLDSCRPFFGMLSWFCADFYASVIFYACCFVFILLFYSVIKSQCAAFARFITKHCMAAIDFALFSLVSRCVDVVSLQAS